MKKFKSRFIIIGLFLLILLVVIYFLNQNYQRNKCFNLNMETTSFLTSLDKCYISGVINKEKKDYLEDKYNNKIKNQDSPQINNDIIIQNVNITPGGQYALSFRSNYCDNRIDRCNGCKINFYNNDREGDKNIIFTHNYQNSGMNFINKSNIDLLDKSFCFNLDCGQGKSPAFCVNKEDIK